MQHGSPSNDVGSVELSTLEAYTYHVRAEDAFMVLDASFRSFIIQGVNLSDCSLKVFFVVCLCKLKVN